MLFNLVRADLLKLKRLKGLWILIFASVLLYGGMLCLLGTDARYFSFFYYMGAVFFMPVGVAIISGIISAVDQDNLAILYTKNHRFGYFISKVITLALISFLTLFLIFLGFWIDPMTSAHGTKDMGYIALHFLVYYFFLLAIMPAIVLLSSVSKNTLITVMVVASFYLAYPFVNGFIVKMYPTTSFSIHFSKMDSAINSYLPQNIYDGEFIGKAFFPTEKTRGEYTNRQGKKETYTRDGASLTEEMLFRPDFSPLYTFSALLNGKSKALYVSLAFFFLAFAAGYAHTNNREIN